MYIHNWFIRQFLHAINSAFTVDHSDAPTNLSTRAYAFKIHPMIINSYQECLWRLGTTKTHTICNLLFTEYHCDLFTLQWYTYIPKFTIDIIHHLIWPNAEDLRAVLWIGGYKIDNFDGVFRYGIPICNCTYYDVRIYFYNKHTNVNVRDISVYVKSILLDTRYRSKLQQNFQYIPVLLNNRETFMINSVTIRPCVIDEVDINMYINMYPKWYKDLLSTF